jgi:hypothetical protein
MFDELHGLLVLIYSAGARVTGFWLDFKKSIGRSWLGRSLHLDTSWLETSDRRSRLTTVFVHIYSPPLYYRTYSWHIALVERHRLWGMALYKYKKKCRTASHATLQSVDRDRNTRHFFSELPKATEIGPNASS